MLKCAAYCRDGNREDTLNGGLTSSTKILMLIAVVGMRKMMLIWRLETSIREYADKLA